MAREPRSGKVVRKEDGRKSKRVPINGNRDILTAPTKPGYVRRWFNDVGNRLAKAEAAWWSKVEEENVQVGDDGVTPNNQSLGTGAVKSVNSTGTNAVLMEIKAEYYNEDFASKQAEIDERERAMKKSREKGTYGGTEIGRS